MGLYDDGGVKFARETFDNARERGIEQAKKADEEGYKKGLLRKFLIEPAIGGIFSEIKNSFEERGQALQDKNVPMRTYLQNFLNNQEQTRKSLVHSEENQNGFVVNGTVDLNLLQNYIASDLKTRLNNQEQFQNLNITQLDSYIQNQAKSEATRLRDYYQNLYNESMDVPDMNTILSEFDKWNSRENPKNAFGQIFKSVKKLIGMETEETINYKNLEAHENLRIALGDAQSRELIELKNAVEEYDKASTSEGSRYNIDGLIQTVQNKIEAGEISGRIIEGTAKINKTPITSGGVTVQKTDFDYLTIGPDGLPQYGWGAGTDPIVTKIEGVKPPTETEIGAAKTAMMNVLTDSDSGYDNQLYRDVIQGKGSPSDPQRLEKEYATKIAYAAKSMNAKMTEYGVKIDPGQINSIAALYVLNHINAGYIAKKKGNTNVDYRTMMKYPPTNPDLYDLLSFAGQTIPGADGSILALNSIQTIIRDVSKNLGPEFVIQRLTKINTDLQATIMKISRDSAGGFLPLDELPDFVAAYEGSSSEEKTLRYEYDMITQLNNQMPEDARIFNPIYNQIREGENFVTTEEFNKRKEERKRREEEREASERIQKLGVRGGMSGNLPYGAG